MLTQHARVSRQEVSQLATQGHHFLRLQTFAVPQPHHCKRRKLSEQRIQRVAASQSEEIAAAQGSQESTALQVAEQQSYHSIFLEGCEVLIGATDDDRLDLGNVFVRDSETDIFAEPECMGPMPDTLQRYAEVPWVEEFQGDTLNSQPGWKKVLKVYLIRIEQEEPFRLDLESVFSFDHSRRVLQKEEVLWLTEQRDLRLITLRIRPEGLYIEENSEMMSSYHLCEEFLIEQEEARVADLIAKNEDEAPMQADEGPKDPIDALNDDEREYDETMEDTPSIDQGF